MGNGSYTDKPNNNFNIGLFHLMGHSLRTSKFLLKFRILIEVILYHFDDSNDPKKEQC